MYCKHCGKQIADDSTFCQFCGKKVDSIYLGESNMSTSDTLIADGDEKVSKDATLSVDINSEETDSSLVKPSKNHDNKSTVIADEIVSNLKMIGLAIIVVGIYMICFMLMHHRDIAEYGYMTKTSYYGESCYDPSTLTGNWKFHWEQHYYELLYYNLRKTVPNYVSGVPSPEECLKEIKQLEAEYEKKIQMNSLKRKIQPNQEGVISLQDFNSSLLEMESPSNLKKKAVERAKRDIQDWNDTINNYRKKGYENDCKKNALYSTLLCLALFIFGRYFVKLVRWVNSHKTKEEK